MNQVEAEIDLFENGGDVRVPIAAILTPRRAATCLKSCQRPTRGMLRRDLFVNFTGRATCPSLASIT
jgi:hypothetical protein